jgi:hypothetical protein
MTMCKKDEKISWVTVNQRDTSTWKELTKTIIDKVIEIMAIMGIIPKNDLEARKDE